MIGSPHSLVWMSLTKFSVMFFLLCHSILFVSI